tara:strand:+ start:364 stop:564 length:201 start_codon:yes stop_codon:yes gene_type:complete
MHIFINGRKPGGSSGLYKVSLESNEILQVAHIFATADAADGFNYGSKTSLSSSGKERPRKNCKNLT